MAASPLPARTLAAAFASLIPSLIFAFGSNQVLHVGYGLGSKGGLARFIAYGGAIAGFLFVLCGALASERSRRVAVARNLFLLGTTLSLPLTLLVACGDVRGAWLSVVTTELGGLLGWAVSRPPSHERVVAD